jgi:prolyl oligopeptidase
MKKIIFYTLYLSLPIYIMSCHGLGGGNKFVYPTFPKSNITEIYHNTPVPDPYRWLEDPNTPQTQQWVEAQNKLTFNYLNHIPYRQQIKNRLTELWNFAKYSPPFKEGDKYYFYKNNGLQNQSILYTSDSLGGTEKIFIDPNTLSQDGTSSLGGVSFSKDGRYAAYQVSEGGSDWRTIYVLDASTKQKLNDKIEWVKFSGVSWHNNGFYYSRYNKPDDKQTLSGINEFHQVYYHKLGTSQAQDELIFIDRANPLYNYGAGITDDGQFLILSGTKTTSGNSLYFKNIANGNTADFTPIVKTFDNDFDVIDNLNDKLLVLTNYKAPNQQLLLIDTHNPQPENWQTLVPEAKEVISSVQIINNQLVILLIKDASSVVRTYDLSGKLLNELKLPEIGTVSGISGKRKENWMFYSFTSFTRPATVYQYHFDTNKSTLFNAPKLTYNPDDYQTKQIFYASKDGTKVPMFITSRKDLQLNAQNPTLLYGYGGFNISIMPTFSPDKIALLENGGIYAVANIRGGGEYGEKWHKQGTVLQKQNVFDDFAAAAEYLIANKYTSPQKLAIEGRSNGGLLVGASITQRPELFRVAFPGVGVMDMLRFHKFTIGRAWIGDYGSSDTLQHFPYLYKYSPVHNVRPAKYPATLVTTADHDDRVVPAHSYKFISELQAKNQSAFPTLIRIDVKAGHGAGKPTDKVIQEKADMLAFMYYNMGYKEQVPH